MERKKAHIFMILLLIATPIMGQASGSFFNTVGMRSQRCFLEQETEETSAIENIEDSIPTLSDSVTLSDNDYSMLSMEQLEKMIARYENYFESKKQFSMVRNGRGKRILSYYKGKSHDLTMENLISVLGEVGLSNKLFVLAQAVLETGNFSSHVCHEYHNLFGLYDSRHHDYYRFERWEDSVVGYQRFIQYRYKGGNYLGFLDRIGYAEGKGYTKKVAQIAKQLYQRFFSD